MKLRTYNSRGFTLIELLVVLALTAVVMGLIFSPLMQSFQFTHRAEILVRAQDDSRLALSKVSHDLNEAMYVYDNTRSYINMPVVDRDGAPAVAHVYYAKVDMVLPRMKGYCIASDSVHTTGPREYDRGDEASPVCPVDGSALELRPVQPLTPDTLIVRYFIGLNDPTKPYHNRFLAQHDNSVPDNMYVLYRVEFNPYDDKLFDTTKSSSENLNDPDFFYNSAYAANWRKIARPVVSLNGTDMIKLEFDTTTGSPMVTPTVKFAPTAVYNDPLVATTGVVDSPEHGKTPATVFKSTYGNWVTPYSVAIERGGSTYKTAQFQVTENGVTYNDMGIFEDGDNSNPCIFDITKYLRTRATSKYGVGYIPANPKPSIAFTVDSRTGFVNFAFPAVDPTASDNASIILGGKTAVSLYSTTRAINQYYTDHQGGAWQDVYRLLTLNKPTTDANDYSYPLMNSTIVDGSVRVIAPDADANSFNFANPSAGKYMLYSKLPYFTMDPGVNQFTLDPDYPVLLGTGAIDPSMKGTAAIYFHSAQIQSGAENDRLPDNKDASGHDLCVYSYYEVQNNKQGDKLYADYVTKSLLTVTLGIRIYDPATGNPESVQLTNKIRLKNVAN